MNNADDKYALPFSNKAHKQNIEDVMTEEAAAFMRVIAFVSDENQMAMGILLHLKQVYKEFPSMLIWLKRNQVTGQKLVELFQNESPDGGGYHMGATYILSRIKGHKHGTVAIKIDELK